MYIALSILLVVVALIIHELGHAQEMVKKGVGIKEFGIGFRIPHVPCLEIESNLFPNVTLIISPVLLGAYVSPSEQGAQKLMELNYKDSAMMSGAGIWANLLFGAILLLIVRLISTELRNWYWIISAAAIGIALWFGKKIFCHYLLPICSILLFGFIAYLIAINPAESLVGPVGIISLAVEKCNSIFMAVLFGAAVSLGIGLINMLPLIPLDGARIIDTLLKRHQKIQKAFRVVGGSLFFMLMIFVLTNDIFSLFK